MSFFFGLLLITIAILILKTLIKTAGGILAMADRVFRHCQRNRYRRLLIDAGQPALNLPDRERDWEALSRDLRKEILARGVRASAEMRRLSQLDLAIEIEKREIELVRLKVEKAQIKARSKTDRSRPSLLKNDKNGAIRSVVPLEQLQAMRVATRSGRSLSQNPQPDLNGSDVHTLAPYTQRSANPSADARH
jgi:hypothetical protein